MRPRSQSRSFQARATFRAGTLALTALAAACEPLPDEVAEKAGPLYSQSEPGVADDRLWPGGVIPVCFKNVPNGDNGSNNYSKSLRDAVESKWGRYGNIAFVGWGSCPDENPGEVVQIINGPNSQHPHVDFFGRKVGEPTRMFLDYGRWDGCETFLGFGASDWNCFSFTAMHEFGHAIGFLHEQLRTDNHGRCTDANGGVPGSGGGAESPFITGYDPISIMNYCNSSWNNGGNLSVLDIAGLQALYGRRPPGQIVSNRGGRNIDSRIDFGGSPGIPLQVMENVANGAFNQLWSYKVSAGTMTVKDALGNDWCMDDPSGDRTAGSRMNIQSCASRQVSRWEMKDMSIRTFGAACIDRPSGSLSDGTKLQLYHCTNGGGERWTFTQSNELRTNAGASGSKCMDVGTGAGGTRVTIQTCNGSNKQKFDLKSRGEIRSRLNGSCLTVADDTGADGTPILINACTTALDNSPTTVFRRLPQLFNFTLTNFKGSGGQCVEQEVTDISRNFNRIKVAGCTGSQAQTWDYYFRE